MEDVQYHLNNLFRFIKEQFPNMPPEAQENIRSAANATDKHLKQLMDRRRNYAQAVKTMRNGQKAYFKATREGNISVKTQLLQQSRLFEAEVDKQTEEIITGAVQPDLFV